jgi:hypothetical protein
MALAESWHLRSRARECAATGRPFADGEAIITALFPDPESSGYLRKDFSIEAWHERDDQEEKPFSFWRAAYQAPATAAERPGMVEKESAEDLLKRLVEEDEDHTENVRYILAVMLERQKLLRETDNQRTPTGILRVYEHRKTGEIFIIKDPDIPLSKIDEVQSEIVLLLEGRGKLPERPLEEADAPDAPDPADLTDASDPADPAGQSGVEEIRGDEEL